jgi:hypothetical protein
LWANVLIPLALVAAGLALDVPALLFAAPVLYLALVAVTLFDLQQARCVQERIQARNQARGGERPG